MVNIKKLPHDNDAEETVNGSILIDGECIRDLGFLRPSDFFTEQNRIIFQVCQTLYERFEAIDQITVASELSRTNKLQEIGGAAYLSHLISITPTSLDVVHYATIVNRLAVARSLILAAEQIASLGYEANPDIEASIDRAAGIIDTVKQSANASKMDITLPKEMSSAMLSLLENGQPFLSWGFLDLDAITTGIYAQDYIIFGARPSVGKTEIMIEVSENIARQGKRVLFTSTEMGINPVVERYIARSLKISIRELRTRIKAESVSEYDERVFMDASGVLSELPIYYLFGNRTSNNIWRNARKMKEVYGLDAIFVDYLQLLTDCNRGRDNHSVNVGLVSHNLKAISKDLNVPIIVASQLNRLVEYREDKRPKLADLRESGDIEQDADVVFLMHRPELYPDYNADDKGVLEIIMAKNRQLGMGDSIIRLQWIPNSYRYGDKGRAYP